MSFAQEHQQPQLSNTGPVDSAKLRLKLNFLQTQMTNLIDTNGALHLSESSSHRSSDEEKIVSLRSPCFNVPESSHAQSGFDNSDTRQLSSFDYEISSIQQIPGEFPQATSFD